MAVPLGVVSIKNVGKDNECFYAADFTQNKDGKRHEVFTWCGRDKHEAPTAKYMWRFEKAGDAYAIKNVGNNEYLYASDFTHHEDGKRRQVFTFCGHDKHGAPTRKFTWRIEPCVPKSVHKTPIQAKTLAIVSYGTRKEPVFLVRDRSSFNDRGRTIKTKFCESLRRKGISIPEPTGSTTWKSWGHGDRVTVRELEPMADRILAELRVKHSDAWHVMTPGRGYDSKDANVYSKGGSKGKHQDSQPYGSLVFVFCAGLSCRSSVWFKNGVRKELTMQSGDCMIFEGKTWHQVHECIPNSSPFAKGEWLADRRLSILVRQRPPRR